MTPLLRWLHASLLCAFGFVVLTNCEGGHPERTSVRVVGGGGADPARNSGGSFSAGGNGQTGGHAPSAGGLGNNSLGGSDSGAGGTSTGGASEVSGSVALGGNNAAVGGGTGQTTVKYEIDDSQFANPERGFFTQDSIFPGGSIQASKVSEARSQNISLIRSYFRIDNFRDAPLSQEMLYSFENSLNVVRAGGAKLIPRFSYNFGEAPDAPLSRILEHIAQLKPILRANGDVIAFFEAGFLGFWGEWHDSTNSLTDNVSAKRQVVEALLDALPADRSIVLRYNYHKRELFGDTALSEADAFGPSLSARVGEHNDCFGASEDNWGTYNGSPSSYEVQKAYLSLDNRFVPQGGETCNLDFRCQSPEVLIDLERMHWDTINIDYHPDCVNQWRSSGAFGQIEKSLGYRLRLTESGLASRVAPGGTLTGSLSVVNDGWGKVYNPRDAVLILRTEGGSEIRIGLPMVDARRWLKGATIQVPFSVNIPADAATGSYSVWLGLLDPASALAARPEYAIRLANMGVWDPVTGLNNLKQTVQIAH